jgi:O-antigen ligase
LFRERKRRLQTVGAPTATPVRVATAPPVWKPPYPQPQPVPAAAVQAPAPDGEWESAEANPVRRLLFYFALAAIFIRFSVIHEALAAGLNLNLYLLYLVMPPALLGVLITGGIRRTLRARSALYWVAFLLWICLATVFSSWRGGSALTLFYYARSEFIMLFVVAGLTLTWKECMRVMYTLAFAGVTDLVIGRLFLREDVNRVDLAMGGSTIGNANDLAAHFILVMIFLSFLILAPKVPFLVRMAAVPMVGYGVLIITGTGSRGALLALAVSVVFTFVMGSARLRLGMLVFAPIAALAVLAFLPHTTLARLGTIFSNTAVENSTVEAVESAEMRRELLLKSVEYTVEHPLFGVGPGQFSMFEGGESVKNGHRGMWHETHNVLTQISSECGIPALIFFLSAILSAFLLVMKAYRRARQNAAANAEIMAVTFCLMLSWIGFMTAISFLNLGYRFYAPALCGLCIAAARAAHHEMDARKSSAQPAPGLSRAR